MLFLAATLLFFPHYEVTRSFDSASLFSDPKGNAYVVSSAYLSKLDPDGNLVYQVTPNVAGSVYSTVATLDASGNVYAALNTFTQSGGSASGYLAKVDPTGNILYTFPLPVRYINAVAAGLDGAVYLTGSAWPDQLQTTSGAWVTAAQAAYLQNAYVVKLNPATRQVIYTTFLDNSHADSPTLFSFGTAIAGDASGYAFVAGTTNDPGFPTTAGAAQKQCTCAGVIGAGAFAVRLAPDGSWPVYSTFLPGDTPMAIAPGAGSSAQFTIATAGSYYNGEALPRAITTLQLPSAGNVITDLVSTSLSSLIDPRSSAFFAAVPDGLGHILATGQMAPAGVPVSAGAFANGPNFAVVVRAADGAILYSTRLPNGAAGVGIAPDGAGGFILAGGGQLTRLTPAAEAQPAILGVTNAAVSMVSPGVAPGEIVSIYGTGLGPAHGVGATYDSADRIPMNLAGTEVYFNSMRAPILYAGYNQVEVVAPFEITGQTVNVTVKVNGAGGNTANLPQTAEDPQVFQVLDPASPNYLFAIAVNQDGTLNSQQNPASLGSIVAVFLNGAGLLTPAPADGARAPAGLKPVLPFSVQAAAGTYVNPPAGVWIPCEVLYAGSVPDEVAGKVQVNFRIPPGLQKLGQNAFQVSVGGTQVVFELWTPLPPAR